MSAAADSISRTGAADQRALMAEAERDVLASIVRELAAQFPSHLISPSLYERANDWVAANPEDGS